MNKKEESQKIKLELDNIKHRIAILKNEVKLLGLEKKVESQTKLKHFLANLEKRKQELDADYATIKNVTEEKWASVKTKTKKALKDLQKSIDSTMKKLK